MCIRDSLPCHKKAKHIEDPGFGQDNGRSALILGVEPFYSIFCGMGRSLPSKNQFDLLSPFDSDQACDGQTDRQTERITVAHNAFVCNASRAVANPRGGPRGHGPPNHHT